MSEQAAYGPEEQGDAWLRRQIAAAAGPDDVGEMSDARLENMLEVYRDETYPPEQLERLLARFWIEVSQTPSTEASPEQTGEEPSAGLALRAIREKAVSDTVIPATARSDTAAGSRHAPASAAAPGFGGAARQGVALQSMTSFLSEYTPLLCLAVTVVAGLVLAWHWPTARRTEVAVSRPTADLQPDLKPANVGRISGAVDCSFADGAQIAEDAIVQAHQELKLERGLLEITYHTGAKAVLQGPARYTVESAKGGFLSAGRLTVLVESNRRAARSKAQTSGPKFVLRTPSLTVNDLGTEFGVEVKPNRVTEVCVFRGKVETLTESRSGRAPVREQLAAGEALRFISHDVPLERMTVESLGASPLQSPGKVAAATRGARQSPWLAPTGLVATAYHRVWDSHGKLLSLGDRKQSLQVVSDGIFGRAEDGEGPRSSFDTLDAENPPTDFVGLTYRHRVRIDRVKVFLGYQFGDGGSWSKTPRVFILINPIDTGSTPPESNPANWRQLPPPQASYGTTFERKADVNPGEVIEFVLTRYPAEYRTGYGWATGGVPGNGKANYVSITELRGYGEKLEK